MSSCAKKEDVDLKYFFKFLMFENYGAFVVFGSKPMCQISIGDPDSKAADDAFHKWFDGLPDDKKATIESVRRKDGTADLELKRHYYKGWVALNKRLKNRERKNYLFRVVPLRSPDAYDIMLINIAKTTSVLSEHYEIFKKAAGMEFDPSRVVLEAEDPDSPFWKEVFALENHLAKGLLFGFGLRNSLTWTPHQAQTHAVSTATVGYGAGSVSHFSIPLFGMVQGDQTAERYRREKEMIEKIYKNRDLVEVTFEYLCH